MHSPNATLISEIRSASRALVRQLGLMNKTVAGTDLSLSAVHAIIEIGRAGKLPARDLCDRLRLEKSTVSRLVKGLVDRGEIRETRSREDLRVKLLQLTARGKRTLDAIDKFGEAQVTSALERLDSEAQVRVLTGLQDYSRALQNAAGSEQSIGLMQDYTIHTGYTPAIIARTVEMLHLYMHRHFGFGAAFEARITSDLAEFMARIAAPENGTWHAEMNGAIVGAISIDGQDLGDGLAHLRWFVVSDAARGSGIGRTLLARALNFCDQREYRETQLWTVRGLDAARRLYENHGFELAEEYYGDQWGTPILEQKFVRTLRSSSS
jgi:DNA-binding MarR family transcriptional regulator/ribosomal protein S18 acetylase RimI-like enzyme